MVPDNATMTCTAGAGRMIDYWIVSDRARLLLLRPRLVRGTPWKTHSGIAVDLVPLATLVEGTIVVKNKAILSEATKASTGKIVPIHDKFWHEASQAYTVGVARHGNHAQKQTQEHTAATPVHHHRDACCWNHPIHVRPPTPLHSDTRSGGSGPPQVMGQEVTSCSITVGAAAYTCEALPASGSVGALPPTPVDELDREIIDPL